MTLFKGLLWMLPAIVLSYCSYDILAAEWIKWPFRQTVEEKEDILQLEKLEKKFFRKCEESTPWNCCQFYTQVKLFALGYSKECRELKQAVEFFDSYPKESWFGQNPPPRIDLGGMRGVREIPWEWIDAAKEVLKKSNEINVKKK